MYTRIMAQLPNITALCNLHDEQFRQSLRAALHSLRELHVSEMHTSIDGCTSTLAASKTNAVVAQKYLGDI